MQLEQRPRPASRRWRPAPSALAALWMAFAIALLLTPAHAQPELTPQALEADELDPAVVARLSLRFQVDVLAMEVLPRSGAAGLVLGVSVLGQTVLLEAYGSTAVGADDLDLDHPLDLRGMHPLLPEQGSAREVMALAGLLTQQEPVSGEDVLAWRAAARAPLPSEHPALPGGSALMDGGVSLGHLLLRRDDRRPGLSSLLLLSPRLGTVVFVHLLGLPERPRAAAQELRAASGAHDPAEVLAEGLLFELWGDLREQDDPWKGWPVHEGQAPPPPATGAYLPREALAGGWPAALRAAVDATWRLQTDGGQGMRWTPPAAFGLPQPMLLAPDGLYRRGSDGAPTLPLAADADGPGAQLLLQAPGRLELRRLPLLMQPWLALALLLAAGLLALVLLIAWPWGSLLRRRRLEPRGWELPRVVHRVRTLGRVAAVPALLLSALIGWTAWRTLAGGAALPMAWLTPLLQALALVLAVAVIGMAFGVLAGLFAFPKGGWRWLLNALAVAGFVGLLALGWVWGLWSPEAFRWWG